MAKFIDFDIEKIREENNGIKTDLGLIQDIINRIDDRMSFICRVDTFDNEHNKMYEQFGSIKSEYEILLRKLGDITDYCDEELNQYLTPDEPAHSIAALFK